MILQWCDHNDHVVVVVVVVFYRKWIRAWINSWSGFSVQTLIGCGIITADNRNLSHGMTRVSVHIIVLVMVGLWWVTCWWDGGGGGSAETKVWPWPLTQGTEWTGKRQSHPDKIWFRSDLNKYVMFSLCLTSRSENNAKKEKKKKRGGAYFTANKKLTIRLSRRKVTKARGNKPAGLHLK